MILIFWEILSVPITYKKMYDNILLKNNIKTRFIEAILII